MNWADESATETQLSRLVQLGCSLDHPLTKREAGRLISWLEENPAQHSGDGAKRPLRREEPEAYRLRLRVEHARRVSTLPPGNEEQDWGGQLALAVNRRQEFWLDTCRDVNKMRNHSPQILILYRQFGCRFCEPSRAEVQEVLDALDTALPFWDIDQPAIFYQTLELNFPELLRRL